MKLYYDKRLSDPTYYAQQGIRIGNKTTTRNVKKIGKHSELLKITDDPLEYAKHQIELLNEEYRVGKVSYEISADFNEKVPASSDSASASTWVNIGYFVLQDIMKDLKLSKFFSQVSSDRKFSFDPFDVLRFLTYARILDPSSKHSLWDRLSTYYEKPDFGYQHILRTMDLMEENYSDYISWLYNQSSSSLERDPSVIYYDCTNFYFECEKEDETIVDPVTGEVFEGLRRYGPSKEHRPNPLVEMGLVMDKRGIPISMCLHPGNTNEQSTAIPLEYEVIQMLKGAKFIYCADGGLGSYNIRKFNSMGGRAFIVTQSVKKLSDALKTAVFNDYDYRLLSNDHPVSIKDLMEMDLTDERNLPLYKDYAYKIIPADKVVDLGLYEEIIQANGKRKKVKAKGTLQQRIIIRFSRKMMEYQRAVRNRQVERAVKMLKTSDPEEIKKGPNDVRRFLRRVTEETGEKKIRYELDEEKIREEEKYDGFYALATNLGDNARDIIEVFEKRYKIEECFRIMKTTFTGRPVYHSQARRIKAHFMVCYTALLVYRLLECRLEDMGCRVTANNIITTLKNMNVTNVHDVEYMALYKGSRALDSMMEMTGLMLDRMHYRPKELNSKIKKISK